MVRNGYQIIILLLIHFISSFVFSNFWVWSVFVRSYLLLFEIEVCKCNSHRRCWTLAKKCFFLISSYCYSRLPNKGAGTFITFWVLFQQEWTLFIEYIYQFLKSYNFWLEKSIISYKKCLLSALKGNFQGGTFISFTKSSNRHVYSRRHTYFVV